MKKTIIKDTFTTDEFTDFQNQSEEIKRYKYIVNNYGHEGIIILINEDDDLLKYTYLNKKLFYVKKRFFTKSEIRTSFTLYKKNKTVKIWCGFDHIKSSPIFNEIFKYLNITWINEIHNAVISKCLNKTLFTNIITGKITNQKQFFQKYMSISLKIPKKEMVSWKLMKDALMKCCPYGNEYTIKLVINNVTNINLGLKKLNELLDLREQGAVFVENDVPEYHTYIDTLKDAEILGKKVNPNWSSKRMQYEHTLMTEQINKLLMTNKANNAIYMVNTDSLLYYPNNTVRLLDTELDVFQEGLTMHHCLYTSYWTSIKNKNYFAFSAEYPERCTIGVRHTIKGEFIIDQIYKKYDANVTQETRDYFNNWIKSENMQKFLETNYLVTEPKDYIKVEDTMNTLSNLTQKAC